MPVAGPFAPRFFSEIVKPTVDEYLAHPENVRRGRLASIVLNHMADYWCQDCGQGIRQLRTDLIGQCPSFQIVMDVADATKHVKLDSRRGPGHKLTDTSKIKKHLVGALGTVPLGMVPLGTLMANGVEVTMDNGEIYSLAYAVQVVTEMWETKLHCLHV